MSESPSAEQPRPNVFALLAPALQTGAAHLRDPVAYLAAAVALLVTLPVAGLIGFGLAATAGPFEPGPAIAGAALGGLIAAVGFGWAWTAIAVRAATSEQGEPVGFKGALMGGLLRLGVVAAGALLLLAVGIPLLAVFLLTRLMAGIPGLSLVAVLVGAALVVAVFVWVLALMLVGYLLAGFAAADRDAGVMTILRRATGLALSRPVPIILLLAVVAFASTLVLYLLLLPMLAAGSVGGELVETMKAAGRMVSAVLLSVLMGVGAAAVMLVPTVFSSSALAGFACGSPAEPGSLEEAASRIGSQVRGTLRRTEDHTSPGDDSRADPPDGPGGGGDDRPDESPGPE